jgi:hypothetical protein
VIRERLVSIGVVSLLSAIVLAGCASHPSATGTPAISTPAVPTPISVSISQRPILKAHAVGVQIYACRANPGQTGGTQSYGWTLKAPEASLFDANGGQIGKHYAGPTWELNDGSKVVGVAQATLVAPGDTSIPWLLLKAVQNDGAGALTPVRAIQRVDTVGGKAPTAGCDVSTQEAEARVRYEANYYFYVDAA